MKLLTNSFLLSLFCLLFLQCSDSDNDTVNVFPLSGFITDTDTRLGITGVEIRLSSNDNIIARSDKGGYYSFGEIPSGKYKLTVFKYDYELKEIDITLDSNPSSQNVNVGIKKKNKPNVGVVDYIAITDGAAFKMEVTDLTEVFFLTIYESEKLPPYDEQILADLLEREPYTRNDLDQNNSLISYAYNMPSEKSYTFLAVGADKEGRLGDLFKFEFSTKSAVNQPVADIEIELINWDIVIFSTFMNEFCNMYSLLYYTVPAEIALEYPDIYWAADCYFYSSGNLQTENLESFRGKVSIGSSHEGLFVTLGYDKNGASSSIVRKVFFSSDTNTVIEVPVPTMRTDSGIKYSTWEMNFTGVKAIQLTN